MLLLEELELEAEEIVLLEELRLLVELLDSVLVLELESVLVLEELRELADDSDISSTATMRRSRECNPPSPSPLKIRSIRPSSVEKSRIAYGKATPPTVSCRRARHL